MDLTAAVFYLLLSTYLAKKKTKKALLCRMAKYKICSGALNPVFSCSSLKHDSFLVYLLAVVLWHSRPRLAYILGHYGHARSQGGRQPTAAKPLLAQY